MHEFVFCTYNYIRYLFFLNTLDLFILKVVLKWDNISKKQMLLFKIKILRLHFCEFNSTYFMNLNSENRVVSLLTLNWFVTIIFFQKISIKTNANRKNPIKSQKFLILIKKILAFKAHPSVFLYRIIWKNVIWYDMIRSFQNWHKYW